MRALLERGLRDEGYEVVAVGNGVDALIALAAETFSVAAVDVMLPEMSGLEVCRHIRARGSSLPILLLTARDSVEDRVRGLESGADDYVVKPFAIAEVVARLRALTRRGSDRSERLAHGEIVLDTATGTVLSAGKPVQLTAREAQLLELLLRDPRAVVSRGAAIEAIWGGAATENIVDRYVARVRRKLGDPEAIRTVRGVGFILAP